MLDIDTIPPECHAKLQEGDAICLLCTRHAKQQVRAVVRTAPDRIPVGDLDRRLKKLAMRLA